LRGLEASVQRRSRVDPLASSRNDPEAPCAAVFERAAQKVSVSASTPLYHASDLALRRQLADFLRRYGFTFDETR